MISPDLTSLSDEELDRFVAYIEARAQAESTPDREPPKADWWLTQQHNTPVFVTKVDAFVEHARTNREQCASNAAPTCPLCSEPTVGAPFGENCQCPF